MDAAEPVPGLGRAEQSAAASHGSGGKFQLEQPGRPGSTACRGCKARTPDNTRGSVNINANEAARYYDVTLSNPGTITLDMNPQIDALSIAGAQSQLVIGGPYTLQVLLDTTLSAGILTMLPGGILATGSLHADRRPAAVPVGAQRQRQDRGCQHRHLGRHLGRRRDAGTLWSVDPVHPVTAGTISGQFAQFISSPPSAFLSLSGPCLHSYVR